MSYKPGDTFRGEFITSRFDTGNVTDADSLPTATMVHNTVDDFGVVLTVAKVDTGRYRVTGTIPSGYVSGDTVQVVAVATVNSVDGKGVVDTFVLDGNRVSDLNAYFPGGKVALSAAGLDAVLVEAGINARQILSLIGSAVAGLLSGAVVGPSTIVLKGVGNSTTRITVVVDGSGNRTSVTLTPPP